MGYLLENQCKLGLTRDELSGLALALIEGNDSLGIFVQSFIYTLITFPECQKRAQDEINRVIGAERIPMLGDFKDLPYLAALIQEHHRMRPVFPHAFPHISKEDLMVQGYIIPAGSAILMNTWGIKIRSLKPEFPELFDEPNTFKEADLFELAVHNDEKIPRQGR
ncbi:cytochrome P450 [Phlegmacium glaucopus]|nr:cytochrome P450 [Phlegmacium glaucopus]